MYNKKKEFVMERQLTEYFGATVPPMKTRLVIDKDFENESEKAKKSKSSINI